MPWIEPDNPTSDNVVTIWVVNPMCAATYIESRVDSHYYFTSKYPETPQPCLSAPVPVPFKVGRLEAGDYQVTHTSLDAEPVTQAFSVTQGDLPFPLPSIPTLGVPATILLTVALAWIANRAFKKEKQKIAF